VHSGGQGVESPPKKDLTGVTHGCTTIATLTVSFGLVSIPVKLFSATEASRAISFNLLHNTCGSRLKQQYVCVKEDVIVPREDMVKGYEFEKDQYVRFTPRS